MSITIVCNSTFQKVANTLFHPRNYRIKCFMESYSERNLWPNCWEGIIQEIEKMRVAQYRSYEQRYKEGKICEPFNYCESRDRYAHLAELLKALECIIYQIEEKDFDATFVQELIPVIKDAIIEDLPEYKAAVWG